MLTDSDIFLLQNIIVGRFRNYADMRYSVNNLPSSVTVLKDGVQTKIVFTNPRFKGSVLAVMSEDDIITSIINESLNVWKGYLAGRFRDLRKEETIA